MADLVPMNDRHNTRLEWHERLLIGVDRFPAGALLRVAVGFSFLAAFARLAPSSTSPWVVLMSFVGVLVSFRLIPAFVRRVAPFSDEVHAVWARRRGLAKRFDSYQWGKLLWFGVGMALHVAWMGAPPPATGVLVALCLVGGGLGLWQWRRRIADAKGDLARDGL